jgi:hypothetical protein
VIGLDGEKLMLDSHLEALVSYLANKNMALALESEPGGKTVKGNLPEQSQTVLTQMQLNP